MPTHTTERVATAPELDLMKGMLAAARGKRHAWKQGAENALVLWAAAMLGFVLTWQAFAWIARKTLNAEFGWASAASIWIIGASVAASAVYAVGSSHRWVKGWWHDQRPALREDVAGRTVREEHYDLTTAKRFQEPEHGGLIYFLRTTHDKVLTIYDRESQDRGVQDEDPLGSSFKPRSHLVLVRAPHTRYVLRTEFSGPPLEAGPPAELALDPKDWPDSEEYCAVSWEGLDRHMGYPNKKSSSPPGSGPTHHDA